MYGITKPVRSLSAALASLLFVVFASLAQAALLNVSITQLPFAFLSNLGTITYTYNAGTMSGDFVAELDPLDILPAAGSPLTPTEPFAGEKYVRISLTITDNGGTPQAAGVAGDDFIYYGAVDLDGNGTIDPTDPQGVLLTGEVLGFGYMDGGASDVFDFRFKVTGGAMAGLFGSGDIAVHLDPEESIQFVGDFQSNFVSTFVKGSFGGTSPICIDLEKEISIDGGVTWANADLAGDPDVPHTFVNTSAEYRMTAANCGPIDLTNVTLVDSTLGINTILADLPANSSVVLTQADLPALYVANRCANSGTYVNVASISATPVTTDETISDADSSVLICGQPSIEVLKQIRLQGTTTWLDADTVPTAATAVYPANAEYRFIVTNTSTVDMVSVHVVDGLLGIDHVIGGLPAGATAVLDSGVLPALGYAERCNSAETITNVVHVTGTDAAGNETTGSDPAILICEAPPTAALGDYVWEDLDKNGAQDAGEPGREGVTVELMDSTNTVIATQTTDINGYYLFENLIPGEPYRVRFILPAGFDFTLVDSAPDDVDSDADLATGETGVYVLAPGETNLTVDAGLIVKPTGMQGCTPGYWKQPQHFGNWVDYQPSDLFSDVFGSDAYGDSTLLKVLSTGGGGLTALGRHVVAALLNAASPDVDYGMTPAEVIAYFHDVYPGGSPEEIEALKNVFNDLNERGCPLGRADICVDDDDKDKDKDYGDKGGYDKEDDKGGSDKEGDKGGYDKEDDKGGSDKEGDKGGYDKEDDKGGSDKEGDKGGYDKEDDKGGSDKEGDKGSYDKEDDKESFDKHYSGKTEYCEGETEWSYMHTGGSDKDEDKSGSDKYGDKSGSDKYGDKSGSDKYGDKSGSDKYGDKSGSDKYGDKSEADKYGDKSGSDKRSRPSRYSHRR